MAAVNLQQLQPFSPGTNPAETWQSWRLDFETYLRAMKYHQEDDQTQVALFLHVCGDDLKKLYRTFTFVEEIEGEEVEQLHPTLNQVLNKFDGHYVAYKNLTYASFIFWRLQQKPDQTFDQFLNEAKAQAKQCEFGTDATSRNLKDLIIQGIRDSALRERLLRDGKITLQTVIDHCKAAELSKTHAKAMKQSQEATVEALRCQVGRLPIKKPNKFPVNTNKGSDDRNKQPCARCGTRHPLRQCPAYGAICYVCEKKNHWATVCRQKVEKKSKDSHYKDKQRKRVNALEENKDHVSSDSDENFSLGQLSGNKSSVNDNKEWLQEICVEKAKITFKLDTGAQINVIPLSYMKTDWKKKIKPTSMKVTTYTKERLPLIGECYLHCKVEHGEAVLRFAVTTLDASPILGIDACQQLRLIQRVQALENENPASILEEYDDVFRGVGRLKGIYKIQLKEGAIPHIASPRKIPIAMEEPVKKELDHMEQLGVIAKVTEPTDWVSNMVVITKKDKIRICLDPRPLNKETKRSHYKLPTAEEQFAKLKGSKVFTLLDAKWGFWHLPLDEASALLTTFVTPWGRYKFLVMPFGVNVAPEEFQRAMDDIFSAEKQVNPYFDDTLLGSPSTTEHCKLLRRTLEIARKENLKFNKDKVQLAVEKIKYLGHVLSADGIEPDPNKVQAISDFTPPKDKKDLQRFLGMATYLTKFVPNFSHETELLRQLLRKESAWVWDENQQEKFNKIKAKLIEAPVLAFFNDKASLVLSVDASSYGLGATLLQEEKPIAYASATLTQTQRGYSQIEKELLAVIYGLERFHYYTYGRNVEVNTDHKPLLGLSLKPFESMSPRLQRLMIRLQKYQTTLKYVPGKQLVVADALSRAPNSNESMQLEGLDDKPLQLCIIAKVTTDKHEEIKQAANEEDTFVRLKQYINTGWPIHKKDTVINCGQYWHCKEELHILDGLICRGQRIVIPTKCRPDVLRKLHQTHRGIVTCKNKARQSIYWPKMNKDIEDMINNCETCQRFQNMNQHEPLETRTLPTRPWEKIAMDFFHLGQVNYLLVIDYFSKYIELQAMQKTTATATIKTLKTIFARFGLPDEIISDQGPPYDSSEMKFFFKKHCIQHNPSSPHYPRSNGQVERCIQTVKLSLKKAYETGYDLDDVLMDYRSSPSNGLPSPAEMLMGRKIKTIIPIHDSLLRPQFPYRSVWQRLNENQKHQQIHGNVRTKPLSKLKKGNKIWYRHEGTWKKGNVESVGPQPRSYIVSGENYGKYQRNRFHLKPRTTTVQGQIEQKVDSSNVEDYYDLPEQPNNIQDPRGQQPPSAGALINQPPNVTVTRSGRVVRKPIRLGYQDHSSC